MFKIIGLIIALILVVVLLNPAWLPLPVDVLDEISDLMVKKFPFFKGSDLGVANILVVVLMLACVFLITEVLKYVIGFVAKKSRRAQTVSELLLSIIKYASVLIAICWTLSICGVNVAAIFASLGIVSLIIGFGAQSLIEDIITGIFIIFEAQYSIGDIIILDEFRGKVVRIGVRTTTIEDDGGNLKVVNNSDIRNFQNRSKNPSLATVLVGISYSTDIKYAEKVLEEAFVEMKEERSNLYIDVPKLYGVEDLADSGVILKIGVHTEESNIFASQRALRRDIKLLFDEKGIEIPFTQIVIHNAND